MIIHNHDLASLDRRLKRFREELLKSASAGLSETSAADMARLESYLEAAKAYKSWCVSQPEMDLPESSPYDIQVEDVSEAEEVESDDIQVIVNLIDLIRREMLASQSAKRSAGLMIHDSIRFDAMVEKIERFISDYMEQATPLDLPESSPRM